MSGHMAPSGWGLKLPFFYSLMMLAWNSYGINNQMEMKEQRLSIKYFDLAWVLRLQIFMLVLHLGGDQLVPLTPHQHNRVMSLGSATRPTPLLHRDYAPITASLIRGPGQCRCHRAFGPAALPLLAPWKMLQSEAESESESGGRGVPHVGPDAEHVCGTNLKSVLLICSSMFSALPDWMI